MPYLCNANRKRNEEQDNNADSAVDQLDNERDGRENSYMGKVQSVVSDVEKRLNHERC